MFYDRHAEWSSPSCGGAAPIAIASNKLNSALRSGYAERRARTRLAMRPVEVTDDDVARIDALAEVSVVVLVAVVLTVSWESDVERSAAPPGKKVVATDVERGVRFSLDGRVLTVQLVRDRPNPSETVSGERISATCGRHRTAARGASSI